MDHLLLWLIHRTRSRPARALLWTIFVALAIVAVLELTIFCVGLFDPTNGARKMMASWLSHWPWGATVFLLVLVVVALSAGHILNAFVNVGIIRKAPPVESDGPLLSGEVKRFEVLDARNLTPSEFKELEEDFRRGEGMFYYIALVKIASGKSPSRASNWRFTVRSKDGGIVRFTPATKDWGAPPSGRVHSRVYFEPTRMR